MVQVKGNRTAAVLRDHKTQGTVPSNPGSQSTIRIDHTPQYAHVHVQEHGLLSRGAFGGQRTSSRERLTEEQKKELRQMRKRQRVEHRKKKLIKLDEDGVSGCSMGVAR